jgi:hypothetical protein
MSGWVAGSDMTGWYVGGRVGLCWMQQLMPSIHPLSPPRTLFPTATTNSHTHTHTHTFPPLPPPFSNPPQKTNQISKLPSKLDLYTKLAFALKQPSTRLAKTLKAAPTKLTRAIKLSFEEGKEGEGGAAPAGEEPPAAE